MNKIWNSARFILMNLDNEEHKNLNQIDINQLDITDKWILSKLNKTILKSFNINSYISEILLWPTPIFLK